MRMVVCRQSRCRSRLFYTDYSWLPLATVSRLLSRSWLIELLVDWRLWWGIVGFFLCGLLIIHSLLPLSSHSILYAVWNLSQKLWIEDAILAFKCGLSSMSSMLPILLFSVVSCQLQTFNNALKSFPLSPSNSLSILLKIFQFPKPRLLSRTASLPTRSPETSPTSHSRTFWSGD